MPDEEQDLSQVPGEQSDISWTANHSELPVLSEEPTSASPLPTLELASSTSISDAVVLNAFHSNIESIVATSTSIPPTNPSTTSSEASPDESVVATSKNHRLLCHTLTGELSDNLKSTTSEVKESAPVSEVSSSTSLTCAQNSCLSDIKSAEADTSSETESHHPTPLHPESVPTPTDNNMEAVAVTADLSLENGELSEQPGTNPMEEVDDTEEGSKSLVAPSNTPITSDSGHNSPTMESSRAVSSDDGQKEKTEKEEKKAEKTEEKPVEKSAPVTANAIPVKEASRNGTKESKKDKTSSGKTKKKEDKGIEYILRALNSLQTPEEKLAALCKRYADMHEEHRVLQTSFKTQQRTMTMLMREKDQVQSDHAKAVIAKSKLESLCRELQKQNKLIKDESIQRAKEDDEKRREISAKFQTTIGEIQTQMNNNNERNTKLQKENMELAGQLKKFVEQYENREKKMKQHRDLEQQVAEARLVQARAILKEEQEKNAREKELLLMKATESAKKVNLLEAQVTMFKDRYDEFESLHARSNETFQKYKTEMDKMTKRIKRLEKDGLAWKGKWERTNKSLVESIEARSNSEKETAVYVQKTKKLESLCRALQAELHKDKVAAEAAAKAASADSSPVDEVPPNSPETPASGQTSPDSTTPAPAQSDDAAASSEPTPSKSETSPEAPKRGEGDGQSNNTSDKPNSTTNQTPSNETTESSNSTDKAEETHQQQGNESSSETTQKSSTKKSSKSPPRTNPMEEVES